MFTFLEAWPIMLILCSHCVELIMFCVFVWDEDLGKSNDFLGSLVIGCSSKGIHKMHSHCSFRFILSLQLFVSFYVFPQGKRLKQWKDCIRLPDCFHDQWHYLANDPHPY